MLARTNEKQFVIGNSSAELLVLKKRKFLDDDIDGNHAPRVPAFSTIQTIKLSSDEHITALACSKSLERPMIAVGKVNGLSLLYQESNQWHRHKDISIPHTKGTATIIWALVFV